MLTTTIKFHDQLEEEIIGNLPYIKKQGDAYYQFFLTAADKSIGDLVICQNKIEIKYSGELMLAEYIIIHDIILQLQKTIKGEVDDSKSFLGYLPNGESAYITRNWDQWISHINHSMQHCKNEASSS